MQKAVGRKQRADHFYRRDSNQDCRSTSLGFLLTASGLLPSFFSVALCLCGN